MRTSLFSAVAAAALLTAMGIASAETTTTSTTTWTNDQGAVIREYSTTKHYTPVNDTQITTTVGSELPQTVHVYALPDTVKVPDPDRYSYVIVNDHPVVVETKTRKIVHTW